MTLWKEVGVGKRLVKVVVGEASTLGFLLPSAPAPEARVLSVEGRVPTEPGSARLMQEIGYLQAYLKGRMSVAECSCSRELYPTAYPWFRNRHRE